MSYHVIDLLLTHVKNTPSSWDKSIYTQKNHGPDEQMLCLY